MNKKILVVEDDAVMVQLFTKMLTDFGYHVIGVAHDGQSAVTMALKSEVELIIMDIVLDGSMSGLDAARIISQHKDVPVVFVTGLAESAILEEAKALYPYGYLVKPFNPRDLEITVMMAFNRWSLQHQLKESEALFRKVVENNPVATVITEKSSGRIVLFNNRFCGLTGYSPEEIGLLNAKDLYETHHQRDKIIEMLEDDSARDFEIKLKRKGGRIIWVKINTEEFEYQNAQCILSGIIDITERVKQEELLKSQEKQTRIINDNLRQRNRELETIREINLDMQSASSIPEAGRKLMKKLSECLDLQVVYYTEFDAAQREFTLRGVYPEIPLVTEALKIMGMSNTSARVEFDPEAPAHTALAVGKDWLTHDFSDLTARSIPKPLAKAAQSLFGVKTLLNLPIMSEGELIGSFVACIDHENFTKYELAVIRTTASLFGFYIRNYRLNFHLHESRERLASIFTSAAEGMLLLDRSFHVLEANSTAQDLLGLGGNKNHVNLTDVVPIKQSLIDKLTMPSDGQLQPKAIELEFTNLKHRSVYVKASFSEFEVDNQKFYSLVLADMTELKKLEQSVRDNELRLRSLVENTYDLIQMVDSTGKIVFVNPAWTSTFGYNEMEMTSKNVFSIIHPDSLHHCQIVFQKTMSGESVRNFEAVCVAKDGRLIEIEGNTTPFIQNGKVVFTFTVFRDVTDRKIKERQLAESERQYRRVVETQSELICRFRPDTTITFVNQAYCKFYGIELKDIIGQRYIENMDPKLRSGTMENIRQVIEHNDNVLEREYVIQGQKRWLRWHSRAIRNQEGVVIEIHTTGLDLTDRRFMEESLISEKKFSDFLINSLSGIFALIDSEGYLVRWNQSIEKATGLDPDTIKKMRAVEFVAEQDRPVISEKIEEAFKTGRSSVELNFRNKNGQSVPFYINAYTIESANNIYLAAIGFDMTEKKRVERDLMQSRSRIEALIENTQSLVWSINRDYTLIAYNSNFHDFITKELDVDLKPGDYLLEINPSMTEFWKMHYDRCLSGERFSFEFEYEEEEAMHVYESSCTPIFEGESVTGLVVFSTDITERRRAEEGVATIMKSVPLVIYSAKEPSEFAATWISSNVEKLTGFSREKFLRSPFLWRDRIHPDDKKAAETALSKVMQGEATEVEYRWRHENGTYRWFMDRIETINRIYGGGVEFSGIWLDITDRKNAEEKIIQHNRQLSILNEIGIEIGRSLDLGEITQLFSRVLVENLGYNTVIVNEMDPITAIARPTVIYPISKKLMKAVTMLGDSTWRIEVPFRPEKNKVHALLSEGKDWIGHNFSEMVSSKYTSLIADAIQAMFGVKTFHNIPLTVKGKLLGTVIIATDRDTFTDDERIINLSATNQLASAFENVRLFSDLQHQHRQLILSEKIIRDSEEKYRQIMDLVPNFIFAKDTEGRFILVNQAVADVYGTTVNDLMGKKDVDFAKSEEEAEHFRKDDLEVMHSGQPKVIPEECITDSLGNTRYLQTVKIPFRLTGESDLAVLGVATDITDRKKFESELQSSEERYRALIESFPEIILVEMNHKIVYANEFAQQLLQYQREEWAELSLNVLTKLDLRSMLNKTVELQFVRKDGAKLDIESTLVPIEFNRSPSLLILGRDITTTKKLKEKSERMDRLAALGQMSAVIAHEIRNPLGAVELNLDYLVRKNVISERYKAVVSDCELAFTRIKTIINDILNFARPKPLELRIENVHEVIEKAVKTVLNEMDRKEIQVDRNYKTLNPQIQIDAHQMIQVLVNLITNAIEFMEVRGQLVIETQDVDDNLVVRIQDNGKGISPEALSHIFDPFFTTRIKGTGLGLAIVQQIIEKHNSAISVDSAPGNGTTFTITLNRKVQ